MVGGRYQAAVSRAALKGRSEETAQWLEVEVEGLEKAFIVLFKGRETLVQRKPKRYDN